MKQEPLSLLEHRLARLESVAAGIAMALRSFRSVSKALPEGSRDLEELAELVLTELNEIQQKACFHMFSYSLGAF